MIRVLLADDHAAVRRGLAALVQGQPDLELVGEAPDGVAAVTLARAARPDVIVMDVSMPGLDGVEATRRIRAEQPGVRIIGLSMHSDADLGAAMRNAGAWAYLCKDCRTDDLLAAIRCPASPPPHSRCA